MLPWVAALALDHARRQPSTSARLQSTLLQELAALDGVYSRQGRFLSLDQESQAQQHCTRALQALVELSKLHPEGPWRVIPKCHALHHIAWDSAMSNPRQQHCYQDEDFIGLVKRMYVRCHGATAPVRVIQRYMMGMALQLAAREERLLGTRPAKPPGPRGGPIRGVRPTEPAASDEGVGARQGAKRGPGRPPMLHAKRPRGRPPRRPH